MGLECDGFRSEYEIDSKQNFRFCIGIIRTMQAFDWDNNHDFLQKQKGKKA